MSKVIIGRTAEGKIFEDAMVSQSSEFVAITGRRRIGKTFLVNHFFDSNICFYFTGIQNKSKKIQLQAFAQELARRQNEYVPTPESWINAFELLRKYVESQQGNKKKVIFLD